MPAAASRRPGVVAAGGDDEGNEEGLSTHERILRAALELFLEHGYGATSLREIAERLGFTKAALYYHYRAKDDLLLELLRPLLDALDELLTPATTVPDRRQQRAVLSAYLETCLEHRRLVRFVARDVSALNQPQLHDRVEGQNRRLKALLTGPDPDPADTVRASSAIGAIWRPLVYLTDIELEEYREVLLSAALAVLSSRGRPQRG